MSTSVISKKAKIGVNVKIGHFCIVEDGASIGDNSDLGDYCIVRKNAKIGSHCKFTAYCEIRQNVVIGDRTTMGSRCTISANALIGKDVVIKYGFVLTDTPKLSENEKKTVGEIGDGVLIGANVTIMPGVSIGQKALIGANSQVRTNVPKREVWYGVPAKYFKKNE